MRHNPPIPSKPFLALWLAIACSLSGCSGDRQPADRPAEPLAEGTTETDSTEPDSTASDNDADPGAVYLDAEPGHAQFTDGLPLSGIDFRHTDGGGEKQYIVQTVVAGLALFDYDGDGFVDVYFLNGSEVPGVELDPPPRNALYRNNGDWTFTDVSRAAGVADPGYGLGVVAADYDNDGDQDLYVNNFGPNVLYRNNGDGTFTDVTEAAGVACDKMGAGAAFLDIEGDGDLDLYVGNYVDFSYDNYITRSVGRYEYAAAPGDYNPLTDLLFRNNGDGTFSDISDESGVSRVAGPSMGIVTVDYDHDADPDIMICCDNAPNLMLRNDGTGKFEEVGVATGVAHDLTGRDNGSMGVDCGDYDNDGRLDLIVTNYQGEMSVLYRNVGGGFFSDVSRIAGVGASSLPHVKWGTTFADFDNDADRDVFIACGHFIQNIQYIDDRTAMRVPNFLLENQGNGRFIDVAQRSGEVMATAESSKGAGFDDLDNDGDIDAVILNANGPPSILRNDTVTARAGVLLVLRGASANSDAVGSRVTVVTGDTTQVAEVHSGRGYQSHYGSRLHFGLDGADKIDRIEVEWAGGEREVIDAPPASLMLLITEGGRCQELHARSASTPSLSSR